MVDWASPGPFAAFRARATLFPGRHHLAENLGGPRERRGARRGYRSGDRTSGLCSQPAARIAGGGGQFAGSGAQAEAQDGYFSVRHADSNGPAVLGLTLRRLEAAAVMVRTLTGRPIPTPTGGPRRFRVHWACAIMSGDHKGFDHVSLRNFG